MASRLALVTYYLCCLSALSSRQVHAHTTHTTTNNQAHLENEEITEQHFNDKYHTYSHTKGPDPPACSYATPGSEQFCVFTDTGFADGRGISIFTNPDHIPQLLQLPAFSQPGLHADTGINHLNSPPFFAQEIEDHGIGLIANRTIQKGEWLMSITPAFIMDRMIEEALSWSDRRYFQRLAFDRLPDALRNKSFELYGQEGSEAVDELDDILITNTFGYPLNVGPDEEDSAVQFRMLFPEIARFNHACRPTANCHFDPTTLAQHIYAARGIFAGEEITINYISPLQKREARVEALETSWGFPCDCKACTAEMQDVRDSDLRVERILELREMLADYTNSSRGSPSAAHELISLLHEEELWTLTDSGYSAAAIEYSGIGDLKNAQRYAELALANGNLCNGANSMDEAREDLVQLHRDPKEHWSWKFRAQGPSRKTWW